MAEFDLGGVKLAAPDAVLNGKLREKLRGGGYEGHEAKAARLRVRPGLRVLELGAGLGYIAAICAELAGAENVVTVEANPDMIAVIRANLDRNGQGAVTLLHAAVVGADFGAGAVQFEKKKAFWAGRLADEHSNPAVVVPVPVVALSALLAEYRPRMVIMDIEGAEQYLFDAPWPAHVDHVMMELHPNQYPQSTIKQIVDCMSVSGLTYDADASFARILSFRRVST